MTRAVFGLFLSFFLQGVLAMDSVFQLKLGKKIVLDQRHVVGARAVKQDFDLPEDYYGIALDLSPEGKKRISETTRKNLGKELSFFVSGKQVASPVIMAEIKENVVISGKYSEAEAKKIAQELSSGRK